MLVLAILGWILLGLLALFVLVLLLPTTIRVQYSPEGLFVWLRVLCLRIQVFPFKAKPRAKRKKEKPARKAKAKKGEEPAAAPKEKTLAEKVALGKRLARAGVAAMKVVLRHMRIRGIQLVLPLHAEDAAATALLAGRVQRGIGTVRAALAGRLNLYFKRLQIIPDFCGQRQGEVFLACKVVFNPVIMMWAGFVFLRIFRQKRPYGKAAYKRAIAEKKAAAQKTKAA